MGEEGVDEDGIDGIDRMNQQMEEEDRELNPEGGVLNN